MSAVLPAVEPAGPARTSGLVAILEHTRYVLGENRDHQGKTAAQPDQAIPVLLVDVTEGAEANRQQLGGLRRRHWLHANPSCSGGRAQRGEALSTCDHDQATRQQ